jgi:anti-sigma factor RsiW
MNCEKALRELVAYADGELSANAAEEVRMHLDHCPACRLEAQKLAAAGEMLGAIPDMEPSPDFTARTVERALSAPELKPAGRLILLRRLAPVAAAAAVILTVTLWVAFSAGPATIDDLPPAEQEIVRNFEILENLELLEDLDLLKDMDLLLTYDEEDFESS